MRQWIRFPRQAGWGLLLLALTGMTPVWAEGEPQWAEPLEDPFQDVEGPAGSALADPLEPLNRVFFVFNDRLYFWAIKPAAQAYAKVLPEPLRVAVRRFFHNARMPIRAVNCLLQGKVAGFGRELLRFFVNSTAGMLGFADVAESAWGLKAEEEDLGQTLGRLGLGPTFYIHWPFVGPSSLRDTLGTVGDGFLSPLNWIVQRPESNLGIRATDAVNRTSMTLGEYEALKRAALDPYVALRDAYHQNRQTRIQE